VKEIRSMVEHFKAVPDFRGRFESYPLCGPSTLGNHAPMKTTIFTLEFINPAMISGASCKGPSSTAEIRVTSIRGQLRWWFRALGGSSQDEALFFGSVAGDDCNASALILRVRQIEHADGAAPRPVSISHEFKPPKTARDIGCSDMNTSGYLAFNLRKREDARAMIPCKTRFVVELRSPRLGMSDFHRLCQVFRMFATFGSLGTPLAPHVRKSAVSRADRPLAI